MEITYREAKQNNVDIAIFAADIYQQDGEKYIDAPWSLENSYLPENDPFNSSDIKGYIFNITDPSPCNKLFKKEFKISNQLCFHPFTNSEDASFVYTALAAADKITAISKANRDNAMIFYDSYSLLQTNLIKAGLYDRLKRSFINRALDDSVCKLIEICDKNIRLVAEKYFVNEIAHKFEFMDKQEAFFYSK